MYLAHAPISFLTNRIIQKRNLTELNQSENIIIGLAALFFGILPDFDMLVLLGTTTPTFMHHSIISHAPLFYIAIWIFLKLLFKLLDKFFNKSTRRVFNPLFTDILINTFLIGTLLHLLGDIFAEDIMLFYPFSTQYFTLFKYSLEPNLFTGYFYGITAGVEAVIIGIFIAKLLDIFFKKGTVLKVVKFFAISLGVLFFSYTVYTNVSTYNSNILYGEDNKPNYDIDYDTLYDGLDMDVDNDGKDNIIDINLKTLVARTEEILKSKKWTADPNDTSLIGKIRYKAGGLTSFRLISQAYWNSHSPISPVLKDMLTKDGSIQKYSWEYNSLNAFYKYFNTKELLTNWDRNTAPESGAVMFVLDEKENVLNTCIVLTNGNIGVVLPYDKNLQTHTYTDLTNYYSESNMKFLITK